MSCKMKYPIQPNYPTYPYKHTVKQFRYVFRLQPVYFFVYFLIKAYVMGTHLNCINLMQFKWVPITYAFIKKIIKKQELSEDSELACWVHFIL